MYSEIYTQNSREQKTIEKKVKDQKPCNLARSLYTYPTLQSMLFRGHEGQHIQGSMRPKFTLLIQIQHFTAVKSAHI